MSFPVLVRTLTTRPASECRVEGEVLQLFEQYRSRLLRYLFSRGLRGQDAEEVVQDVFLALFEHVRAGRDQNHIRGWLFRVTHNLGLKRRVATRRNANLTDESIFHRQIDPRPNPEEQVDSRQRQARLLAVFEALPKQDRSCIQMRAEGLRYREIAAALGISLGSVAQSLTRSLERLQRSEERY